MSASAAPVCPGAPPRRVADTPALAGPASCHILFVDDEPAVLDGIRRTLRTEVDPTWRLHFAAGPAEALACLAAQPCDVVVSDMRMPGLTGAELLGRIAALAPDCIRIMLTGQTDLATAQDAINRGNIFRLLIKPCGRAELRAALEQAVRQRTLQTAERRLLQAQLEHAQKLGAVGQLAAGIVHDVNNILNCITALSDPDFARTRPSALREIGDAALQAATLTRELMSYCRRDEERPLHPVDLGEVVAAAARLLAPTLERRVSLHTRVAAGLPAVLGHTGKLKQVLTNLVVNARDATPEGGAITIAAEPYRLGAAEATAWPGSRSGDFVRLSVADTGCGMDEATQRRVFEPFFTTKADGRGTGLGLALVRDLVDQHGGWLGCRSAPGTGTTFFIHLPVARHRPDDVIAPN